jgi:hypothetical protein
VGRRICNHITPPQQLEDVTGCGKFTACPRKGRDSSFPPPKTQLEEFGRGEVQQSASNSYLIL